MMRKMMKRRCVFLPKMTWCDVMRLTLSRSFFSFLVICLTQGFLVALLYCFLNGEVQQELGKFWRNRVVSGRESRPHPTHSLTFHSVVTQSVPLPHLLAKTNPNRGSGDTRSAEGCGDGCQDLKIPLSNSILKDVQETSLT